MGAVLLDPPVGKRARVGGLRSPGILLSSSGRPEFEEPFDRPGPIAAFTDVGGIDSMLAHAPERVKRSLDRAGELAAAKRSIDSGGLIGGDFEPRASVQGWEETIYSPLGDGTAVTAAAEATMVPILQFPPNYFYPGRLVKWTVMGRQSTVITTPGTITLRLAYSATGLGAVVVAASGAFAPDPTAAATNLTFMVEWWALCRSSGTAGSMLGWGRVEWSDYDDATVATLKANLDMRMAPVSAPAGVAVDTTVERSLNPTYQSSVATASMTAHAAICEALT